MSTSAVPSDTTTASNPSSELVVPAPLTRSITIQPPKNLALVLSICGEALTTYGNLPISSAQILVLLQHIITSVNKKSGITEEDKKQLALDSIHWLIDNQKGLSDKEKNTLDVLSDTVFPQAVDLLSQPSSCSPLFSCFTKKA